MQRRLAVVVNPRKLATCITVPQLRNLVTESEGKIKTGIRSKVFPDVRDSFARVLIQYVRTLHRGDNSEGALAARYAIRGWKTSEPGGGHTRCERYSASLRRTETGCGQGLRSTVSGCVAPTATRADKTYRWLGVFIKEERVYKDSRPSVIGRF